MFLVLHMNLSLCLKRYVVKAAIPVFTVLMCSMFFGQSYSLKVYLSLIPIVCGVALARWCTYTYDSVFSIFPFLCIYTYILTNSRNFLVSSLFSSCIYVSKHLCIVCVFYIYYWKVPRIRHSILLDCLRLLLVARLRHYSTSDQNAQPWQQGYLYKYCFMCIHW
jgi:hypothetical protein